MKKMIISVLGKDRPGIIAAVTRILYELDCNIENVSQTILQNEFSGIFIAGVPKTLSGKRPAPPFGRRAFPHRYACI
jgi:glycine cleavage system transcriptional repressor